MNINKILSLVLPGFEGVLKLKLNNLELNDLIPELMGSKSSILKEVFILDGSLLLSVSIPMVPKVEIVIKEIEINRDSLFISVEPLKMNKMLLKIIVGVVKKLFLDCSINDRILRIDLSDKYRKSVADLPESALETLDTLQVTQKCLENQIKVELKVRGNKLA